MRRITWLFLSTTLGASCVLGTALWLGAEPGKYHPGPLSGPNQAAIVGLICGIPSALGLLLCGLLELYDRLPPKRQRWLRDVQQRSYLSAGRFRSVPIRLHVGFLFLVPVFALSSVDGVAFLLALLLVVLVHEAGHALLVRRYRRQVLSIDLSPLGGVCRYEDSVSPFQRAVIAWGGVAAQAALQALVLLLYPLLQRMEAAPQLVWLAMLSNINVPTIALNLVPIHPLDGATAWGLLPLWWRRRGKAMPARQRAPASKASHLRVVHDALEQAKREARKRSGSKGKRDGGMEG